MKTRLLLATVALAGAMLSAACAQDGLSDPSASGSAMTPTPTSSSSQPPTPSGQPTLPTTAPATPGKDEVAITGTVEIVGVEGGCKVLRTSTNKSYEIKGGDPAVLKAGAQVTIVGKIRTDIATICQMGPVLEVISIDSK